MKLFYIANARIPTEKAHGLQIMKMCEAFANAGVSVELVLPRRKNIIFAGIDAFTYYGTKRNFTITYLPCIDPLWLTRLYSGLYVKVQGFYFGFVARRYCKKNISNSQDARIYTRDEYLLPLLLSCGLVVWEGHSLSRKPKKYIQFFKRCYRIVTITKAMRDDLVGLGITPDQIVVAPDGVDLKALDAAIQAPASTRMALGLPLDQRLVVYTGHLYEWKGVHTLAQASLMLPPNTRVVMVGGTAVDQKRFEEFLTSNDISHITLVAHQAPTLIPRYLYAADVVVLPNSGKTQISQRYTSPLKLFEYMASKRPIVASNLPSITEVLNDGNAHLVPADDPAALAQGISYILDNQDKAAQLAAQAYQDVQGYTWNLRAEQIISFIEPNKNIA